MIDIQNIYVFKRKIDNSEILYPISDLAGILGLHQHTLKEHYFYCVADYCFSQGEIHAEEIKNNEIEVYLNCFAVGELIKSLKRESFKIDEFQAESVLNKMLETQRIASECFENKNGFNSYIDPARKLGLQFVEDLSKSISRASE